MSTVIILSSSPPRTFARSPTPADSSSPLPSAAALLQHRSPSSKRFKTRVEQRDSFAPAFSTARQVLANKRGAENALIASPGRSKFRLSQEDVIAKPKSNKALEKVAIAQENEANVQQCDTTKASAKNSGIEVERDNVTSVDQVKNAEAQKAPFEPLLLERATSRRLDWTPPKSKSQPTDEKPTEYSAGFLSGILTEYAYQDESKTITESRHQPAENPAKRRRVENRRNEVGKNVATNVPKLIKSNSAPTKRTRSPAKKVLTITGLATSNYVGHEEPKETPLMQYLTSTQAQLNESVTDTVLETKVKKTKAAVLKRAGKKSQPKSLLLSPQSALKTYDEQEAIFGSASQLARDESPTFIRETIEAMKQSESFMFSDPLNSPQRTQTYSMENTPQVGTSRFRRTRNLWAAAGRDEDNALLQVETIDMTDSSAIRAAFAGKDALLQLGSKRIGNGTGTSLRGGYSPLRQYHEDKVIDIDDVATPSLPPTRALSTAPERPSPRLSPTRVQIQDKPEPPSKERAVQTQEPPSKPNYIGFTTKDLSKQISAYGFKAMRKREKMIELLDRCWEEKYGSPKTEQVEPEAESEPQQEPVPFGDFLSKVHDISARPEPKVKKPRVRNKKDETPKLPKEKPPKKPRVSKAKESTDEGKGVEKPKVVRKRKSKATPAKEESILDIDNIFDSIPEELRSLQAFDDWAKPTPKPKPKPKAKPKSKSELTQPVPLTVDEFTVPPTPKPKAKPKSKQSQPVPLTIPELAIPPTPPSTIPAATTLTDTTVSTASLPRPPLVTPTTTASEPILTSTPPQPSIPTQITSAILHQSQSHTQLQTPKTNHNLTPTWHEKILLFDPIILEDLTLWLNTTGLRAIGEDREISALDVREWCEGNGVCCLWRGGWRGNRKEREG